jgi:hypothetical protein
MQTLIEWRAVLILGTTAIVGAVGLYLWPFPIDNPLLGLISVIRPGLYAGFTYTYATLWFSTPYFVFSMVGSFLYVFVARWDRPRKSKKLPPYPAPEHREELFVVLGEQHRRSSPARAVEPGWITIPERGLYTGIAIVGAIGSGKTSACMYPYAEQLLAYRAGDPERKVGGLVLEVKGDFCRHVKRILERHGRGDDYIEVSLESPYRYNPLHNDLDAYALAYGIATLMTNLFGKGKEPFWQQASTNLVKFVILLHQILDDYVTLFQVYEHVINPEKLRRKIEEGAARFQCRGPRLVMDQAALFAAPALKDWAWHDASAPGKTWTEWSEDRAQQLEAMHIAWAVEQPTKAPGEDRRAARFESVKRWFDDDWMSIEPKLRSSIVEGISVFLSLFDDNLEVKYTFCPPKETYDPAQNPDGIHGTPLPPLADLIDQGKVIALNFPVAMNPGLARAIGTMLKQDFQRAVLNRIHRMDTDPSASRRPVMFVCDEYQAFATTGENEPSGDEKFFSLARQAKCIPIVATQSISSLRSALTGESWRVLLQGLRTKIFLALSDDFSALMAADLCGKVEHLKPSYSITEAGQDAGVSMMTGRSAANRTTVTTAKTYSPQLDYVFQPKIFGELKNAQAIVLAYDGLNPQPPSYCYLKPYYLDVQTSYFDHLANGDV